MCMYMTVKQIRDNFICRLVLETAQNPFCKCTIMQTRSMNNNSHSTGLSSKHIQINRLIWCTFNIHIYLNCSIVRSHVRSEFKKSILSSQASLAPISNEPLGPTVGGGLQYTYCRFSLQCGCYKMYSDQSLVLQSI